MTKFIVAALLISVVITLPLFVCYIQDNPQSFLGSFIFKLIKLINEANLVTIGIYFLLLVTVIGIIMWFLFLSIENPIFFKIPLFAIRSLNPKYKTTQFRWNYAIVKDMIGALKKKETPAFIHIFAKMRGITREEEREHYFYLLIRNIEARMDRLVDIDPESPLLKELASEFYNIKVEMGKDTIISDELKQWGKIGKSLSDHESKTPRVSLKAITLGIVLGSVIALGAITILILIRK